MIRIKKTSPKSEQGSISGQPIEDVFEIRRRKEFVSAAEKRPEIIKEWDYSQNCGFAPDDFSFGSQVNAHWICEKKHKWRTRILTRCVQLRNCPQCFGTRSDRAPVIKERSLAFLYPHLIEEWHPTKNGELTPFNVLAGSKKKVYWRCKKNKRHVWEAVIKARANLGSGCPDCHDERILDLRRYPEVLALFDHKKNKFVDPHKTSVNDVMWWRCSEGPDHSWPTRFKPNLNCPFCRNWRASVTNSLATLFPKLAKQLHPTRNGKLTAETICAYTNKKVWWRCPVNLRHIWQAQVNNRTRNGSKCPECWKLVRPKMFKRLAAERKARRLKSG